MNNKNIRRLDMGVDEKKAKKIAQNYAVNAVGVIWANIEHAKRQSEKGKVKNLAGYVVRAIENDYAGYLEGC